MTVIRRLGTPQELAEVAAVFIADLIRARLDDPGACRLALAGGTTPISTYRHLASLLRGDDLADVHFYWGDERCVPLDDPQSNYGMADDVLLSPLAIPDEQRHPIRCAADPHQAANQYELELHKAYPDADVPRFDLVLLGLGEEGHTASLFPGSSLIDEQENWVGATFAEALDSWRVTLTPVAINAAANVAFLVQGAAKADAVYQVIAGEHEPDRWPAQVVLPKDGSLYWFLDEAAAGRL
jgi:6-phosphogluconolactonase